MLSASCGSGRSCTSSGSASVCGFARKKWTRKTSISLTPLSTNRPPCNPSPGTWPTADPHFFAQHKYGPDRTVCGPGRQAVKKVQGLFRQPAKMPLLFRRAAAEKFSLRSPNALPCKAFGAFDPTLRSPNALPCKAFGAFDPTRGGLPPPRAPPPKLRRVLLNSGFLTS